MTPFIELYDQTLERLESTLGALIDSGADFDLNRNGDVLAIEFGDGQKFIISPNSPVSQLWLSANYAGRKFNWSDVASDWLDEKDDTAFTPLIAQLVEAKLNE